MKKLLLLVAIMATGILMSSCDVNVNGRTKMSDRTIYVRNGDWGVPKDGDYLACSVEMSLITRQVCDEGAVMVYLVNGGVQEMVPSVIWLPDGDVVYGSAISFAFEPGWITFYYNTSDLYYPDDMPGDMEFRVVVFE